MRKPITNSPLASVTFIAITSLALSACSSTSTQISSATPSASSSIPEATPPPALQDYTFYFVAETARGLRLYKEVQTVDTAENELGTDKGLNALTMLITGQLPPFDGDHKTLWKSGSKVLGLTREGGVATVDLSLGRFDVGPEAEQRAIDQIIWTLTANDPTVTSVKLTVDGQSVETLAGNVDATETFVPGFSYDVLASVGIDQLDRSDVTSPVLITGMACTFEANVSWELVQNKKTIDSGATTAALACPDRSAWKINLGELTPGKYTIRVFDLSAEDGSLVSEDDKDFTIN
ncbi:MAG: GerMN domain-containing protein [Actinomycetes bacterium]